MSYQTQIEVHVDLDQQVFDELVTDISDVEVEAFTHVRCGGCLSTIRVANKDIEVDSCPRCNDLVCTFCGREFPQLQIGDVCPGLGWDTFDMKYVPCRGTISLRSGERYRLLSLKISRKVYGLHYR